MSSTLFIMGKRVACGDLEQNLFIDNNNDRREWEEGLEKEPPCKTLNSSDLFSSNWTDRTEDVTWSLFTEDNISEGYSLFQDGDCDNHEDENDEDLEAYLKELARERQEDQEEIVSGAVAFVHQRQFATATTAMDPPSRPRSFQYPQADFAIKNNSNNSSSRGGSGSCSNPLRPPETISLDDMDAISIASTLSGSLSPGVLSPEEEREVAEAAAAAVAALVRRPPKTIVVRKETSPETTGRPKKIPKALPPPPTSKPPPPPPLVPPPPLAPPPPLSNKDRVGMFLGDKDIVENDNEHSSSSASSCVSRRQLHELQLATGMAASYREALYSTERVAESLRQNLRQTQGHAEYLLQERNTLLMTVQDMEDMMEREALESYYNALYIKACMALGLLLHLCGGSDLLLIISVVLYFLNDILYRVI